MRGEFSWSSDDKNVTPRFLTESDMGTDALPTDTESGKEEDRELNSIPEDTITASALSSLS